MRGLKRICAAAMIEQSKDEIDRQTEKDTSQTPIDTSTDHSTVDRGRLGGRADFETQSCTPIFFGEAVWLEAALASPGNSF